MNVGRTSDFTAFDGTSANSTNFTAGPYLVGEFARITASLDTDDGGASRLTFQYSNEPGSPTTYFTGAVLTARGYFDISTNTAPARWLRLQRSSLDSQARVWLHCRTP